MEIHATLKGVNAKGKIATVTLDCTTIASKSLLPYCGESMLVTFNLDQISMDTNTGEVYE